MRTIVGLERHGRSLRGMLSAVLVGAALMGTANAGVPARETALWCDPACGAIVADWGLAAYATIRADNGYQNPLPASRALAAMHLAMHDAINAAASRYARYVAASDAATPTGPVPADPAAAAIVAAHDVLLGLYPSQQAQLAAALDAQAQPVAAVHLDLAHHAAGRRELGRIGEEIQHHLPHCALIGHEERHFIGQCERDGLLLFDGARPHHLDRPAQHIGEVDLFFLDSIAACLDL